MVSRFTTSTSSAVPHEDDIKPMNRVNKTSAPSTVAAIVVTYNRLDKLRNCIDSIVRQSTPADLVVVVDNASNDGTSAWLAEVAPTLPRLVVERLEINTGGAGGFSAGIQRALRCGAKYLWVMDDDCKPSPSALELLIEAFQLHEARHGWTAAFACSRVLWSDGVSPSLMNSPGLLTQWDLPYTDQTPVLAAAYCSFVSCLFLATDVRRFGLPLAEYFIWYDDIEFTRRLSQGRYGLAVLKSVVIHDTPQNTGARWSLINQNNLSRFQYGMRNEASWRFRHQGFRSYFWFFRMVRNELGKGDVLFKHRFALYWWAVKALWFNPKPKLPD